MKIRTQTGSMYELDLIENRFRRLTGEGVPTPRMGNDGQWKTYQEARFPVVGEPLLVIWRTTDDGVMQTTMTSPVKDIFDFTESDMAVCSSFDTGSC